MGSFYSLSFEILEDYTNFASIRVTQISKAMQTMAIRTVAYSLPENEVILLTLLISSRYIPFCRITKYRWNNRTKDTGLIQISKPLSINPSTKSLF